MMENKKNIEKGGIENDGENIFFETVGVHMQLPTNVCVCK